MPRFIVLNLADKSPTNVVSRLPRALSVRMSRKDPDTPFDDLEVPIHDLFFAMELLQEDPTASLGGDLDHVSAECEAAEKIFICTHGSVADTDHAFSDANSRKPLGDSLDLARVLRRVLLRKDRLYHLALVMCYGARTDMYRAADLDHQGMIPSKLLATSFAYKVFKNLCGDHHRQAWMSARTGAVQFDEGTGTSLVEQEAKVDIQIELAEIWKDEESKQIIDAWKAIWTPRPPRDAKYCEHVSAIARKFELDPNARTDGSVEQKVAKAYRGLIVRRNATLDRSFNIPDLRKYGKIVYESHPGGRVRITNKYGAFPGGVPPDTVLYDGPFT